MTEPPNLVGQRLDEYLEEMMNTAPGSPWSIRVTRRNGMYNVVTQDYRPDRINVEVENGIIANQHVG